jgi:hypothetical protein
MPFGQRFTPTKCVLSHGQSSRWEMADRPPGWRFAVAAAVCLFMAIAFVALAHENKVSAPPRWFNIPSQPLAGALQAYGEIAGVQVLYESALAEGRRSVAVKGNFTLEAALRVLLSATDLNVFYTRPDAITIAQPPNERVAVIDPLARIDLSLAPLRVHASVESEETSRLQEYSEALQGDIQGVLSKDARTRSGTYRADLKIWIDPSRTIQKTTLIRSTGNEVRDAAIVKDLNGLIISQTPPVNTPQPVRISIFVRPLLP